MTDNVYEKRRQRLYRLLEEHGVAAVLVTSTAGVYYFTGVWLNPGERASAVILQPGHDPVWVVPEMFRHEAAASDVEKRYWNDGGNPYRLMAEVVAKGGALAVDGDWSTRHLLALAAEVGADTLPRSADGVLGALRAVKDEAEIRALEQASQWADQVVARIREFLTPVRTERQAAEELARLWREVGSPEMSFPPIVAAGSRGAAPHHEPDDSQLGRDTTVIVDTGGFYRHYCSDITRTFVLGRATAEMEQVYRVVLAAQQAGIAAAKPGVTLGEVDRAVRQVIQDAGYGPYFTHRTGHGVGLDIHELPYVMADNPQRLEVGMVMSIEPGVYLPNRFGVRIEDLVVIEAGGARSLNRAPKQWEEVVIEV
jgi:Xaa-Pro dipeptidase